MSYLCYQFSFKCFDPDFGKCHDLVLVGYALNVVAFSYLMGLKGSWAASLLTRIFSEYLDPDLEKICASVWCESGIPEVNG